MCWHLKLDNFTGNCMSKQTFTKLNHRVSYWFLKTYKVSHWLCSYKMNIYEVCYWLCSYKMKIYEICHWLCSYKMKNYKDCHWLKTDCLSGYALMKRNMDEMIHCCKLSRIFQSHSSSSDPGALSGSNC